MAHWAQLDNNNIVVSVTVGNNEDPDEGYQWLIDNLGGIWVKTSYTSRGGNRIDLDTQKVLIYNDHFRYNFAGVGYYFDESFGENGAFIPPKPYPSWVLDQQTALWNPPFPEPEEDGPYVWNEDILNWEAKPPIIQQ